MFKILEVFFSDFLWHLKYLNPSFFPLKWCYTGVGFHNFFTTFYTHIVMKRTPPPVYHHQNDKVLGFLGGRTLPTSSTLDIHVVISRQLIFSLFFCSVAPLHSLQSVRLWLFPLENFVVLV